MPDGADRQGSCSTRAHLPKWCRRSPDGWLPTHDVIDRQTAHRYVITVVTLEADPAQRRPWLVMVTGEPGSGKSSLGVHLARKLRVPYLSRDDVRWGLLATAGVWSGETGQAPGRDIARETFLQIVEEVAGRGVSAVLEFIVFRHRPQELQRLQAVADCLVIVTACSDASGRAEERERSDPLLTRPSVLKALGHDTIDDHLRDGATQRDAVRDAMVTEFDLPLIRVWTEDGYDPSLEEIVDWVIARTGG